MDLLRETSIALTGTMTDIPVYTHSNEAGYEVVLKLRTDLPEAYEKYREKQNEMLLEFFKNYIKDNKG